MGVPLWRRARPPGAEPNPRPAVLPELRADLVRVDASGGRADQDPVIGALAGPHPGAWAPVQQLGLRRGVRLPAGLAHESRQQVQRLVDID